MKCGCLSKICEGKAGRHDACAYTFVSVQGIIYKFVCPKFNYFGHTKSLSLNGMR